jgi:hypothetical protein
MKLDIYNSKQKVAADNKMVSPGITDRFEKDVAKDEGDYGDIQKKFAPGPTYETERRDNPRFKKKCPASNEKHDWEWVENHKHTPGSQRMLGFCDNCGAEHPRNNKKMKEETAMNLLKDILAEAQSFDPKHTKHTENPIADCAVCGKGNHVPAKHFGRALGGENNQSVTEWSVEDELKAQARKKVGKTSQPQSEKWSVADELKAQERDRKFRKEAEGDYEKPPFAGFHKWADERQDQREKKRDRRQKELDKWNKKPIKETDEWPHNLVYPNHKPHFCKKCNRWADYLGQHGAKCRLAADKVEKEKLKEALKPSGMWKGRDCHWVMDNQGNIHPKPFPTAQQVKQQSKQKTEAEIPGNDEAEMCPECHKLHAPSVPCPAKKLLFGQDGVNEDNQYHKHLTKAGFKKRQGNDSAYDHSDGSKVILKKDGSHSVSYPAIPYGDFTMRGTRSGDTPSKNRMARLKGTDVDDLKYNLHLSGHPVDTTYRPKQRVKEETITETNKFTHKIWTGPSGVKQYAAKLHKHYPNTKAGTEHVYVHTDHPAEHVANTLKNKLGMSGFTPGGRGWSTQEHSVQHNLKKKAAVTESTPVEPKVVGHFIQTHLPSGKKHRGAMMDTHLSELGSGGRLSTGEKVTKDHILNHWNAQQPKTYKYEWDKENLKEDEKETRPKCPHCTLPLDVCKIHQQRQRRSALQPDSDENECPRKREKERDENLDEAKIKKPKQFDKMAHVRAIARNVVGQIPKGQVIVPKKDRKPKHKKDPLDIEEENSMGFSQFTEAAETPHAHAARLHDEAAKHAKSSASMIDRPYKDACDASYATKHPEISKFIQHNTMGRHSGFIPHLNGRVVFHKKLAQMHRNVESKQPSDV